MALADLKRVAERLGYECVDYVDFHWFLRSKHEVGKYASLSGAGSLCSQIPTDHLRLLLDAWEREDIAEDRLIEQLKGLGYEHVEWQGVPARRTLWVSGSDGEYCINLVEWDSRVLEAFAQYREIKEGAGGCG